MNMHNIEQFINAINNKRKKNKNDWYYIFVVIDDKLFDIKGYNTWFQKFKIDGVCKWSLPPNMSVKEFNAKIRDILEETFDLKYLDEMSKL